MSVYQIFHVRWLLGISNMYIAINSILVGVVFAFFFSPLFARGHMCSPERDREREAERGEGGGGGNTSMGMVISQSFLHLFLLLGFSACMHTCSVCFPSCWARELNCAVYVGFRNLNKAMVFAILYNGKQYLSEILCVFTQFLHNMNICRWNCWDKWNKPFKCLQEGCLYFHWSVLR